MAGQVHRAPDCGPARGAAHPEMAERRRAGGWAADTGGGGGTAGWQRIAAAGQRLSPLWVRPLGPGVAPHASARGGDCRQVRGGYWARRPKQVGCPALPAGTYLTVSTL